MQKKTVIGQYSGRWILLKFAARVLKLATDTFPQCFITRSDVSNTCNMQNITIRNCDFTHPAEMLWFVSIHVQCIFVRRSCLPKPNTGGMLIIVDHTQTKMIWKLNMNTKFLVSNSFCKICHSVSSRKIVYTLLLNAYLLYLSSPAERPASSYTFALRRTDAQWRNSGPLRRTPAWQWNWSRKSQRRNRTVDTLWILRTHTRYT